MSIIRKNIVVAILALAMIAGFALAFATPAKATTLRVVQTPTVHLYSGQTISATTMRITPYPKDLNGTKLTITDFGTLPTVTVDPKLSGIEEIESFTTITDNGDNTATLSGLSRNLVSKYPYTTAGTGRSHGAGASVVFGNNPQYYGRLWAPENQATSTATLYFTSTFMPQFDVDPGAAAYTAAPNTVLVDMAQLTRTAIAGATNATRTVQGLVQVAFRGQAASSTATGSTGAFAVLTTDIATSSPSLSMSTSSVVMTRLDSRIDPIFLATTSGTTYTVGNLTVNGTSALSGFLSSASSTVNGSVVIAGTTTISTSAKLLSQSSVLTYTSATTTSTWPMAMVLSTTTGTVFGASALAASTTYQFIGFAVQNLTLGSPALIQDRGIVSGFTGLTAGKLYYLSDSTQGAISTTVGTNPQLVGQAISSTQLLLAYDRLQRTVVTNTGSLGVGNNANINIVVTCPTNQIAVGGGASGIINLAWLSESYPSSSNTWTVTVQNSSSGSVGGTVTAYAVCVNP